MLGLVTNRGTAGRGTTKWVLVQLAAKQKLNSQACMLGVASYEGVRLTPSLE